MNNDAPTDFIGQQLAMASINDKIINEWSKSQKKYQNIESYIKDY